MYCPKPLFPGARCALIAPAGPVTEEQLRAAISAVEALELSPVVFESCKSRRGYLAGEDALRAHDVGAAFADRNIDGILCIRGGYGCQRILDRLDFSAIRETPKFFAGYSDITALHLALNQLCGFCTFHMPMPATEWPRADAFTMESCRRMLFTGRASSYRNPPGMHLRTLSGTRARGILTGGNLTLVAASLGTPYEVDTRGKILFLEDIGEAPYRVDRMLAQLRSAGKLKGCAGILLGWWTGCGAEDPGKSLTLDEVFRDLLPAEKPVLAGFACGHSLPTLSLRLGGMVAVDALNRTVLPMD